MGDPTFFHILPAWSAQNKYGNVTTSDFIALAERKSGRNLTRFFRVWLFQGLPESW